MAGSYTCIWAHQCTQVICMTTTVHCLLSIIKNYLHNELHHNRRMLCNKLRGQNIISVTSVPRSITGTHVKAFAKLFNSVWKIKNSIQILQK